MVEPESKIPSPVAPIDPITSKSKLLSKKFWFAISIIAILTITLSYYFVRKAGQPVMSCLGNICNYKNNLVTIPKSNNSPSADNTTQVLGWQKYNDPQYGFGFEYPADWKIITADTNLLTIQPKNNVDVNAILNINIFQYSREAAVQKELSKIQSADLINKSDISLNNQVWTKIDYNSGITSKATKLVTEWGKYSIIVEIDPGNSIDADLFLSNFKFVAKPTEKTSLDNLIETLKVGQEFNGLTVSAIDKVIPEQKFWAGNAKISYSGTITTDGEYTVSFSEFSGDTNTCFKTSQIIGINTNGSFFCLTKPGNVNDIFKAHAASGNAQIVITDFTQYLCGCDAFDMATLVKVNKYY